MKSVGIFICNYNKREFVVNCVKSVFEQSFKEFDLFVVDNASTDDSVEKLREIYEDKITIIENAENLGGSGGFNTGIKFACKNNYKYIVLLDNDIILDKDALKNMYNFLENNMEFGIVGAKVMLMDKPEIIQDFGNKLNFNKYTEECGYFREKDNEDIPELNVCDYVPTCAVMIRKDALPKHDEDFMPEDNFIYFDDIELCYKISKNGFKVVALGNSKVWHKGGFNKITNTFVRYYFIRNKLHFFSKYVEESKIEEFVDTSLENIYVALYGLNYKKLYSSIWGIMYALDDFLHGIRGKCEAHKILPVIPVAEPIDEIMNKSNNLLVLINEQYFGNIDHKYEELVRFTKKIRNTSPNSKITFYDASTSAKDNQKSYELAKDTILNEDNVNIDVKFVDEFNENDYTTIFQLCEHVNLVENNILPKIYVDRFFNCIRTEEEFLYFRNYKVSLKLFCNMYKSLFIDRVKEIRRVEKRSN